MRMASTTPSTPKAIAIVIGSTRNPRIGPGIAGYIHSICTAKAKLQHSNISIDIVDLADQNLPLYDESAIPSHLPAADPTPHYAHEHTRSWSARVRAYDAFIFVTPQYNWSVPASLKNALDFLFHEWTGKPAGIVTYGGRGGVKAAVHLKDVLKGLRMKPVGTEVAMRTGETLLEEYVKSGRMPEADVEAWREAGVEIEIERMLDEILDGLRGCDDRL